MVDAEQLLRDEIHWFTTRAESGRPDWGDVVARADVVARSNVVADRRSFGGRGRFVAIAVAVAVLLTVLVATPAFGVQALIRDVLDGRIDVQFKRGTPAPTLVKREFSDLGLGAPASMAPQAIVSEARTVTHVRVNGRRRALWVAPTRSGGFCWQIERSMGGCQPSLAYLRAHQPHQLGTGQIHPELLGVSWMQGPDASPSPRFIEAIIRSAAVTRITASFRDGFNVDLPFTFVSAPISAGFLEWTVPAERQTHAKELLSVTARDANGHIVARFSFLALRTPPRTVTTPATTTVQRKLGNPNGFRLPAPTPPFQHGTGDGVTVTVGANGVAVFNMQGLSAERRAASRTYSPGCFKLEHDQLGLWVRGLTVETRSFGPTIKARLLGLKPPYDGCEIGGSYGHNWPDRFESHAVVELPLSAAGKGYFTDRAGLAKYAPRVDALNSTAATPAVGRIGYRLTANGVTFTEISPSGKQFHVAVVNGRIQHQNLKPYAFVF
jgi:hypothetical protein